MPRDVLPEKLSTPSRDEIIRKYERDWQLRLPTAAVGVGTEPGIKARLIADQLLPIHGESARNAQVASLADMDGPQLEAEAASYGIPIRLPAVGASGALVAVTSVGGSKIFAGDQCRDDLTGLRYQCTFTKTYITDEQIPIAGVDTGMGTNAPAGLLLTWTVQRPGSALKMLVAAQSDDTGLTGGRDEETDGELVLRIQDARAFPAVAGNDAAYRKACAATPGVSVQAPFTFPCIDGPGTTGLAFTVRPSAPGASRIPNATQMAAVRAYVVGQFPKDDGLYDITILPNPVSVRLQVQWVIGAKGWADAVPWPSYTPIYQVYVKASPAPTATTFQLASLNMSQTAPIIGQTIAMYDATYGVFRRKKILNVSDVSTGGERRFNIVCDTSNSTSDTTLTPATGDQVCPWSDSLDSLVAPVVAEFDKLGPGEMFALFFDEGLRQKRSPESPTAWPSVITGRVATPLYALPSISDIQIQEPVLPSPSLVGTPGVSVYLHELASLLAFPL